MEPPQIQLSSTYPSAPKEYFELYSHDNIKSGRAPPPPPIIKDNYYNFGKLIDPNDVLIRSLESQGIQRLYKTSNDTTKSIDGVVSINPNNHKSELKKLNHSILIAYLDLLDILVKAPNTPLSDEELEIDPETQQPILKTLRQQKLDDIELLFVNMHHLINELRPHQARDNIRCILEMQKHQRMIIAQKFRSHLHKIVELLKECIKSIQTPSSNASGAIRLSTFLEELNTLMKSANDINQRLDKFTTIDSNKNNNNGYKSELSKNIDTNFEVEMKDASDNTNKASNDENITHQNQPEINCDIQDAILCDLIDDFLIKKNEF